jgi:sugar-specific transcriptional regulator TrmB
MSLSQKMVSETLKGLGLTERDSEVFIFLAKKGPVIARDILSKTRINKAQVYRSLKNLESKGIVESTLEYPARFSAISFDKVLDLFLKAKKDETQRVEENREAMLSHWKSFALDETPLLSEKFMVIEGENYIYSKIGQMIKNSKDQILASTSGLGIIQAEKFNVIKSIVDLMVPLKVLTNVSPKNLPIIRKTIDEMGAFSKNSACRSIELAENLFPRFVIRDEEELIFFITNSEGLASKNNSDTGLWTNNKALVSSFKTFFDQLWRDGLDVQKKIDEIVSGKSVPESRLIRNAEEGYQRYLSLISSAEEEIILMTSASGLKIVLDDKSVLESWLKKKVSARIMAPITSENVNVARQLSKYCKVRHVQISYLRGVIADGKQLLHFRAPLRDEDIVNPLDYFDNSFYTNDPDYIQGRRELLNEIWNNSPDFSDIAITSKPKMYAPAVSPKKTLAS